ncbi:MAG: tetratricopeptide repeat protein [Kofleriaceae bacterium]
MAQSTELKEAIRAARQAPHAATAWEDVERLAGDADAPDEVVALYREVLAGDVGDDVAEMIGERAASFCDEWFGDDPSVLEKLLIRVIELAPRSDAALQRLSVQYTGSERWTELLALYDAALAVAKDKQRKIHLLREASQLAKDVAGQPEKAIGYLQGLLALTPDDVALGQNLERLLERHDRYADLIALWETRLDGLGRAEREKSRLRIAGVWLDNLADPAKALAAIKPLLAEAIDPAEVGAVLERVIESPHTSRAIREGALDLLRTHHEAGGQPREIVRVLEKVIALDPGVASRALREEAGQRLADLDDDQGALAHYAALMVLAPESAVTQERLRTLADKSKNYAAYAQGLTDAARASTQARRRVELLCEAARSRHEELADEAAAIALYQEALETEGAGEHELLTACRRLGELYAKAGRTADRLDVLDRLAGIETDDESRRATLGEAARLAESLGDPARALSLWQRRLELDATDSVALDARITLLGGSAQWDELVTALEQRAAASTSPVQRRADLVRIAGVHRAERRDPDAAIAAWQRIAGDRVDDADAVEALADLYAETGRWAEMASLLERAAAGDTARTLSRLNRLGGAYREHLDAPGKALGAYRDAMAVDPGDETARAGLQALLEVETTRTAAADILAEAYRRTDDWDGVLGLLPARLADAPDAKVRLALLRESAAIRLEHRGDNAGALADLATAFPLAPRDALIEDQLQALSAATGDYTTVGLAYAEAITALAGEPREAARLRVTYGDLLVGPLGDPDGALAAYLEASTVEPGDRRAVVAVIQLAPRQGKWDAAARILLAHFGSRERTDDDLLAALENAATAAGATAELATALAAGLPTVKLAPAATATLYARVAGWHRERGDEVAAIAALRRALELGGDRPSWLAQLVELERGKGASRPLLEALRRLADADPRDLDILVEAADMASTLGERDQALAILTQVFGRATAAWRGTTTIKSSREPESVARWAIDGLVDLHQKAGNPRAALETLAEAARLPFDDATRRALRLRGADLAAGELGDNATAIDMCRGALAAAPGDLEVIDRLGSLLEREDRVPELLGLRQLQLGLEQEPERRLALRLDVARLVALVEERGGRLQVLEANLAERPGHDASVDAIAALYEGKAQWPQLVALLETQATALEGQGEPERAARLWVRLAKVAEVHTGDVERAIAGHRKVVALTPTPDSLRALARLNVERGQPALAVPWLESLLGAVAGGERVEVLGQLAEVHLQTKQPDRAIAALEGGLDEREPALALRTMLADLLRTHERWESLARHLTRSLPLIRDDKMASAFARESADIYSTKLGTPDKAITALQTALALDPSAKELRASLATGLRVAGRLDEAKAILTELINDFGRRRSADRAPLHIELGRVYQAEGQLEEAMAEVEQASKMDVANAAYQKELAELARAAGQLERAERTYRSLLLVVRRQPPGDDESAVGESEVLFELHQLAEARGEAEQAKELLESAVEAAIKSDAEVRRLRRSVLAHGSAETMIQVFELRLKAIASIPAQARNQAMLYADLAEILEAQLGKPGEALDAMLKGIEIAPDRIPLHERARALAARTKQTKRYVTAVETVVDRLRRKDDPPLVADLLLRAGEALEQDADDPRGAAALYRRVETMGERLTEAFYAQARIAGALGDTEEQARALDKMLQQTEGPTLEPTPDQLDAFYRLAELFITTPSRRPQGFDLLERAFAAEPRWASAGRILRLASDDGGSAEERVMALYDRVARNAGDADLLLDFLTKQALLPGATPQQIKEAVDAALAQGDDARAEALLQRAVDAARDTADGVGGAVWAVLALAERRLAAGDLPTVRALIDDIAAIAEPAAVDELAMRAAQKAQATPGNATLAAELYEFLRERSPTERAIWQPLLGLYRELGDGDRLSAVVSSTLPSLTEPSERNAIRLEHARFLIDRLKRAHDAIEVLKDALLDDPDHLEVAALLEQTLRDLGDDEGMADFLWGRFDDAKGRGNQATMIDVAMRLGALLDASGSPDAERVYREALVVAPEDRDLLRQVVAHLPDDADPGDRARLLERLLAVETADAAPGLAAELATAYEAAGDEAGVQRTLELAHKAAPEDEALHTRLEGWYRERELWPELAALMTTDASRLSGAAAVARLRQAAELYATTLARPLDAARVYRLAREHDPASPELATELAAALAAGGDTAGAQAAVGEALADVDGPGRVGLLLLRAQLHTQLGDLVAAVNDQREAYGLDAAASVAAFADGLERVRDAAEQGGTKEVERAATLELAVLTAGHGDLERGRNLLVGWIERDPQDAEPLSLLCDMDESIEHWEGVVAAATRLAYVTEGEAQLAAGMRAADAAAKAGRPADAIPVLEVVHGAQPGVDEVRAKLREFYELGGAHRELAGVLLADAEHGADPLDRFNNYKRAAELLLYQVGDAASAAAAAERALELSPEDFGVTMLNVDVLLGLGQTDQAATVLEAAIAAQKKRTPELAVLQQRMGRISAAAGDRDGQLGWLKKAFDVDRKNGEIAAELAQIATETGDYELALKPLRAISLMENPQPVTRPMALLWEAKIEHARGNRAKAELWAKKALREDPGFGEAQQFLDELAQ